MCLELSKLFIIIIIESIDEHKIKIRGCMSSKIKIDNFDIIYNFDK